MFVCFRHVGALFSSQARRSFWNRTNVERRFGAMTVPVGTAESLYNGKESRRTFRMTIAQFLSILDRPYRAPAQFTSPEPSEEALNALLSDSGNAKSTKSAKKDKSSKALAKASKDAQQRLWELEFADSSAVAAIDYFDDARTEHLYFFEWHKHLGEAVELIEQFTPPPFFTFGNIRTR